MLLQLLLRLGTDLHQVTLDSEDVRHTPEAVACCPLGLHTPSTHMVQEATTMDRSLLRLIPHLAEARGGQGPLVADAFNTAFPKMFINIFSVKGPKEVLWNGLKSLCTKFIIIWPTVYYKKKKKKTMWKNSYLAHNMPLNFAVAFL